MSEKTMNRTIELIRQKLKKQINGFKGRVSYNRTQAKRQHIAIAILSALIAVLSGLNIGSYENCIRISILILASIMTVISAYKVFFNNKELWIKYTGIISDLRKIESDLNFYIAETDEQNIEIDKLKAFNKSIDVVLENANKDWEIVRLKK